MKYGAWVWVLPSLFLSGALWAEPGVTDSRIVIGQSIGLSGPVAAVARDIVAGLAAYVHYANMRGGINGRQLELKTLDDGFSPPRSGENTRALIGEGVRRTARNLTRDRFIKALESMNRYDAGGFEISYSTANHSGSRYVDLTVIDGKGRFLR